MTDHRPSLQPGRPYPLGATWTGRGVNFALFSEHAEAVDLCLFDSSGRRETERLRLPEHTDHVWHGFVPGLAPGQLYGYRVHGPYDPRAGLRFNPHKLLLDPYARAVVGTVTWNPACFGYRVGAAKEDLSLDKRDSARYVPKGMVVKADYPWNGDRRPETPLDRTVLYELHVKGMTALHPAVPPELRGTVAGLAHPAVLDHLARLGVTAVELLPVFAFLDETHLAEKGMTNYWGYNPFSFFAPEPRYQSGQGPEEFQAMVQRFHEAGIEVILDVVYNHTCEGNHFGPTVSLRGIDNLSYYHLVAEEPRFYHNHSGCGNTLNLSHPRVLQMVMDSLRYWVEVMHVDGFRFDLAAAVARGPRGFEPAGAFLAAVRQDPVLNRVKLIAEPWDIGPAGYRLGEFPPGWTEWNDAYRNSLRAFWRGDQGTLGAMATRLAGSSDLFWRRTPQASLNYVTAHDGFTLTDLVSYDHKHNQANLEENKDGTDYNLSWNCGIEGPTDYKPVRALRLRQRRNLIATLLLSQGVPMLLAGDELGRTQHGNNNAYCQDTPLSWLHWDDLAPEDEEFLAFVRQIIGLRRDNPAFRRRTFFTGRPPADAPAGIKDITWLSPEGREMHTEDWTNPALRCVGLHLPGAEPARRGETLTAGRPVLLLLNGQPESWHFVLPPPLYGAEWSVVFDTARSSDDDEPPRPYRPGEYYPLHGRTLVMLQERSRRRSRPTSPPPPQDVS